MTTKISLRDNLLDFSGQPLRDDRGELVTAGRALATILNFRQNDPDPLRAYALSQKMYQDETIELNQSDVEYVEAAIKANGSYYPLVKGQLIMILLGKKEKTSVKEQE